MLKIGEYQTLTVKKKVEFGLYLAEKNDPDNRVLLPKKQIPEGTGVGDELPVFLYRDSKDRMIANVNPPLIVMGEVKPLCVKEVSKIGAFLDWGLEKDLFLPYREMQKRPEKGDEILVRLYVDKSHRLCASMRHLYEHLKQNSPYGIGDEVTGRIYEFGHDFGTFVAVDDTYSAMIPSHEDVSHLHIGDLVTLRITNVKEDGKLDVTLREKAHLQMEDDAEALMRLLDAYAGVLPFTEKASPEVIKRETGLSKAAFKRAVGHLYKERRIDLTDGTIRKTERKG